MPVTQHLPHPQSTAPVVTALVTAFNEEDCIARAVESLLVQDFSGFEVLVVDDGSTDRTGEILSAWDDPRLRVHHAARIGRAAALALGVRMARGRYVAILDADDMAHPSRFALQSAFLDQNPQVAWLGCAERRLDTRRGETAIRHYPLEDAAIRRMAARCIPYAHSGVMFRREVVDQGLNYDPEVPFLIDFDFFLRVAEIHTVANLPEPLITRRLRSDSYFERSFSRRRQNRALALLCLSAVWRLRLPMTHWAFPLGRLSYDLVPNRAKRHLRRWAGLHERFEPA